LAEGCWVCHCYVLVAVRWQEAAFSVVDISVTGSGGCTIRPHCGQFMPLPELHPVSCFRRR